MDCAEGDFFQTIRIYVTLARPSHWLKNGLIFVPLLYANNLTKPDLLLATVQCFLAFCLISSGVYFINDIIDAKRDRQHPIKKKRPIASGKVAIKKAIIITARIIINFMVPFIIYPPVLKLLPNP